MTFTFITIIEPNFPEWEVMVTIFMRHSVDSIVCAIITFAITITNQVTWKVCSRNLAELIRAISWIIIDLLSMLVKFVITIVIINVTNAIINAKYYYLSKY